MKLPIDIIKFPTVTKSEGCWIAFRNRGPGLNLNFFITSSLMQDSKSVYVPIYINPNIIPKRLA